MRASGPPAGENPVDPPDDPNSGQGPSPDEMSPEERQQAEEMAREMAAVQEQIASAPASVVVATT
ncbi:MAG: hypothetical protein Ct9H300mP12_04140 [Acidimicrobiales bacterium]|nr:MAG: hypothetical protein Ct9H300mP12_04140 [Acidimicrobiales bacterium]